MKRHIRTEEERQHEVDRRMNMVQEPDWEWDSGTGGVTARRSVTRAPPGIASRTRSKTQARSLLGWNRVEHRTGPLDVRDDHFRQLRERSGRPRRPVVRERQNLDHLAEVAREIQKMITFCRESMNVRFP